MESPKIFISYSHKDEKWKDRLLKHLAPLQRSGRLDIWDDRNIRLGDQWSKEILTAVNTSDIAVLLISADFLASDFIQKEEIPRILERRQEEGLIIIPIILRPSVWHSVNWLNRLQVLPKDGIPISQFESEDTAFFEVTVKIMEIAEIVLTKKQSENEFEVVRKGKDKIAKTHHKKHDKESKLHVFISHESDDGDFAEVLKLKLEKVEIDAWMDVDRLRVGDDWRSEIDDAIKNSTALIVIMSPRAKESEYVTYEWAFGWGAGVKVIPLMLKPTQLHPRLESLQYLDFTNRRARPWSRLIEELTNNTK